MAIDQAIRLQPDGVGQVKITRQINYMSVVGSGTSQVAVFNRHHKGQIIQHSCPVIRRQALLKAQDQAKISLVDQAVHQFFIITRPIKACGHAGELAAGNRGHHSRCRQINSCAISQDAGYCELALLVRILSNIHDRVTSQ